VGDLQYKTGFMIRLKILFVLLLTVLSIGVSAQVKIRLFSNQSPESAVFSVKEGEYELNLFNGEILTVTRGEPVIVMKYNGKLAVKKRNEASFVCDSLIFAGRTGNDSFSLRINGGSNMKQNYSGDFQCFPDLGTLVFINISDVEKYISGVVMAEGGPGKNLEYFKTQAIIARTYMYKYFDKHLSDRYNVCDNTHCQAFNGLSSDTLLNKAVLETSGLVILDKDSILIISAFHSNCGGETSSSDDVWLSEQPYLKSVSDPYCLTSRNATWVKSISMDQWVSYLRKSGYNGKVDDVTVFNFSQKSRLPDYQAGSFTMPLRNIRSDLNLRSSFFSVFARGDSIMLKGRGYGHGVGLCQEGAMMMAVKGFNYREIINFYYSGVTITDIKNAVILRKDLPSNPSGFYHHPPF
jgi:stage II sporulation protein D